VTIRLFCEGLSLCPRSHCFRRDSIDMNVFGFAERAHAEHFRSRFGAQSWSPPALTTTGRGTRGSVRGSLRAASKSCIKLEQKGNISFDVGVEMRRNA
jgi:hypothetical protein